MPIDVGKLREMRTVTLSNGDRYRFRWVDPSILNDLLDIRGKELDDLAYLVQVLGLMIEEPESSGELLQRLSDEKLIELCNAFLNLKSFHEKHKDEESIRHFSSLEDCRQGVDDFLEHEVGRLEKSSKEVMASIASIATGLGGIQSSLKSSPIFTYLDSVKSMANALTKTSDQIHSAYFDYQPLLRSLQANYRTGVDAWLEAQTNFASMYSGIFAVSESLNKAMATMTSSIAALDLPSVVRGWQSVLDQDLGEWAPEIREHRTAFLVETNLQFLSDLSEQALEDIVDDAMEIPESKQSAFITRRLYAFTANADFLDSVLLYIEGSPSANRRASILKAAHRAHARREFLLSIPVLLAQLEGLTIQLLAEMGFVRWNSRERKWYEAESDTGKYCLRRVYKKGVDTGKYERVPVKGLGDLSKFISRMSENPLPNALPHIRDGMPRFRNQVMHGSLTDYGSSRRSSMLLLMARILSQQLHALEETDRN